jgi:hypothetical protein
LTGAGGGAGIGGGVTGARERGAAVSGVTGAADAGAATGGQAGAVATGFTGAGVAGAAASSSSRCVRRRESDQETQDSERQCREASMWMKWPPIAKEYPRACAVELSSISKRATEVRFMGSSPRVPPKLALISWPDCDLSHATVSELGA